MVIIIIIIITTIISLIMHKFAYAYDRCARMLMSFERLAFQLIQCIWRISVMETTRIFW